jgi:hypothetical protein
MGNRTQRLGSLFLCAVLVLFSHCGTTTVTVNIDALSFIPEEDRTTAYGENPVIPPYGPSVTIKSPVYEVPISGEIESVTEIEEVLVALDFLIENETGTADAQLEVFISGEGQDPFATEPFMESDLSLVPDTSYTAMLRASGDERIIGLFSGNEVNLAAEVTFDASGDQNLKGVITMTRLDIVVTGQGHVGSD